MTHRFAAGAVPAADLVEEPESELRALWAKTRAEYLPLCEGFQFHTALERLFVFVKSINAYIEKRAPWKLGKSADPVDKARLCAALASMAESLRLSACALRPVMPETADKILGVLGGKKGETWTQELDWGSGLAGNPVSQSLMLFPRAMP
jgi:methionyl-tRNA synthetase